MKENKTGCFTYNSLEFRFLFMNFIFNEVFKIWIFMGKQNNVRSKFFVLKNFIS